MKPDILKLIDPDVQKIIGEYIQAIAPVREKWGYPEDKKLTTIGIYNQFLAELEPHLEKWKAKIKERGSI